MADETDIANRPDLRGLEFVPPPEKQLATPSQVADFWIARGDPKWNAEAKADFVKEQEALAQRNPDRSNREMLAQTDRIRSEIRGELAKEISADEIAQRYKDLGQTERLKEFEQAMRYHQVGGDEQTIAAFRQKEAVKVLELEDRAKANARVVAEPDDPKKPPPPPPPGQEPPEPPAPPPGPSGPQNTQGQGKDLKFASDHGRGNFLDLKKEHANAPVKSEPGQDQSKEAGKGERTLTFHSDRHPPNLSPGR